ncbi:MAG: ABC transporter permease [Burkholderiaceae bacterium]|nr:ABC transporter permease [Burkholderiaceae bacterium]
MSPISAPAKVAIRFALVFAFLAAWQFAPDTWVPSVWVSRPYDIGAMLLRWIGDGTLWYHLEITLTAMMSGFVIGSVVGVLVGIVLGLTPFAERVVSPFIVALYSLPKIAIAPLLVILFGIGIESKIVLVSITVFFMMMFSALDGVRDVDRDLVAALRLMGATKREVVGKVLLPGSLAWIFMGLRVSIRLAFTAAILGEIISSNRGIGYLVEHSAVKFDATGVFASIFVVVIFSVAITEIVTFAERSNSRWRVGEAPLRTR